MPDTGFTVLAADRVVLRRFRPADLPAFTAYRSDPAIARYQGWDAPYPAERAWRMLAELDLLHPDTPGAWFQFAVALPDTDELLGDCGVYVPADEPRQAELGFTFAAAWQGRGYATEAVRRLLDYLFVDRGKHRVFASCDDRNVRSAALLRRVGMRREGLRLQSTWSKGEWTNDELYALLADALVAKHTETVEWITTVLAEEALGGPAKLVPTPLQRMAGGLTQAVTLPTRIAVQSVNRAVDGLSRAGSQARSAVGTVADTVGRVGAGGQEVATAGRDAALRRAEQVAQREGAEPVAGAVRSTRTNQGSLTAAELPVPNYDQLGAQTATAAVRSLRTADEVAMVISYEERHKNRGVVLSAARSRRDELAKNANR